jgi:hypothetical protein
MTTVADTFRFHVLSKSGRVVARAENLEDAQMLLRVLPEADRVEDSTGTLYGYKHRAAGPPPASGIRMRVAKARAS